MEKILFIFKDKPWYINHINIKFSKKFKLKYFFLSNNINISRNQIVSRINNIITGYKIKKVFFDVDYTSYIDSNFISKIESENKIGFSFDTEENLEKIQKILSVCTHFLTAEPKFISKFNSKTKSLFFPLETSELIFKNIKIKKKYDILFFGEAKGDRINYLNDIYKFKIRKKILINNKNKKDNTKLNKLINESKIVLNFSKGISKYSENNYDQFKGRILISGLAGTFCLSEKYKSSKYIFKKSYPCFNNSKDLKKTIFNLLVDEIKLKKITNSFVGNCKNYSDKIYINVINKFLNKRNKSKKLEIDLREMMNIVKISSKKNNPKIYIKNIYEILIDLSNSKNSINFLLLISSIIIGIFYFIINIKNNLKYR